MDIDVDGNLEFILYTYSSLGSPTTANSVVYAVRPQNWSVD